jgi:hypothetical protein
VSEGAFPKVQNQRSGTTNPRLLSLCDAPRPTREDDLETVPRRALSRAVKVLGFAHMEERARANSGGLVVPFPGGVMGDLNAAPGGDGPGVGAKLVNDAAPLLE